MLYNFQIQTNKRTQMIDITDKVFEQVAKLGVKSGLCTIFVPHTTAGVTINENADPDVVRDMMYEMDKIVPEDDGYLHFEGNSSAHIKATMTGFSQTIIIENSKLLLGRWQGIYFCEYDGPRNRTVYVKIIKDMTYN
ncbi:MAG: secondary thiamine-phosphate synthase enzyme YjbQ [Clostridia bacterium]|nr:secondary thiamine-phosphate synthase enzyme YjbQ [Clostridia bacterium]